MTIYQTQTGGFIVAKFQEGDKVLIGGDATPANWQSLSDDLIGKIGTVVNTIDYPNNGFMSDVFVAIDGDEIVIEENYLSKVTVTEAVCGQASGRTPRVNYLYVVEDDDGAFVKTFDRGYAREVKAELGGKKAGVIITAYAAVKEIR
jgi:hypothetical protein